jgi:hypothetical protein
MEKEKKEEPSVDALKEELKGRARAHAAYRAEKGIGDDIEDIADDDVYDWQEDRYSNLDGKYNELSGTNKRLGEITASDERVAAVMTLVANGKSLRYAMNRIYGKDWQEMSEEESEEEEAGYSEYLADQARRKELDEKSQLNIKEFEKSLSEFAKANKLSDEETDMLESSIFEDVLNMFMGTITKPFIEYKWKGLNYDSDVKEAAKTGEAEGRNAVIEPKVKSLKDIPPQGKVAATGQMKQGPPKNRSFYDGFKKV